MKVDKNSSALGGKTTSTGLIADQHGFGNIKEMAKSSLKDDVQQRTSELIKRNENLRQSEERYHRMISEVQDYAIILLDESGFIENWNKGAEQIKGYKAEEAIGKNFSIFYTEEDRKNKLPQQLLERARVEGKALHEGWRLKKDGSKFWGSIVITGIHNEQGDVIGFSKVTRDLSEKKRTETELQAKNEELLKRNEELRRSEERYHRMVSEVQDYAIILLSEDGTIENWNKGAEQIKGYKAEEIIGKNFSIFYTEEDLKNNLPQQLIQRARQEGKANHEGWRVRKDGTVFWGNIVITCLHDANNNVIGFSKVTRDLSTQKNSEMELQEKNKELEAMNQELASFAYVSSHDLQEPLRKIQTFASRILETENENLSERGKDYFQRMQNAALRMQTLIEDLLTYSRTNTAEKNFERVDLNTLLDEIKNELSESIEEKKAIIKASPLPTLEVVPFQFRQLLINILGNALKFSKPDTPPIITINADIVKGNTIKGSHAIRNKNYHHIAITDNGIGFEPEHSLRIFEVFQRLHGRNEYGGTGIGLAICKKIMDNHGGMITAQSELDKGATFHLYFPAN